MPERSGESPLARRVRRLRELGRDNQITQVNAAVRQIWEQPGGLRPERILLRHNFLAPAGEGPEWRPAPMPQLIVTRGVALRFYLLAVFDAQCRPPSDAPWQNMRPVSGRMGWEDLIAIDAAYSRDAGRYQPHTRQNRTLSSSRVRQVKGALQKLEQLGDQALVEVPRKANGIDRDYDSFRLMDESGRGEVPTPNYYTVPATARRGTIDIPSQFFLNGWIQVLYPSEIAVWLTLRSLSSLFSRRHGESGVFLYGQDREDFFHLRRDTYEDGCRNLLEFGLIRRAQPAGGEPAQVGQSLLAMFFAQMPQTDENGRIRHRANLYQLTDEGLNEGAHAVTMTNLRARWRAESSGTA
jgi:hypothetical protein